MVLMYVVLCCTDFGFGSMLSCTTLTTFLVFRAMLRLAPCLLEAQVCAKHVCLGLQILSDLDLDPGLRIISVSKHPNLLASQVLLSVVVVVVVAVRGGGGC